MSPSNPDRVTAFFCAPEPRGGARPLRRPAALGLAAETIEPGAGSVISSGDSITDAGRMAARRERLAALGAATRSSCRRASGRPSDKQLKIYSRGITATRCRLPPLAGGRRRAEAAVLTS